MELRKEKSKLALKRSESIDISNYESVSHTTDTPVRANDRCSEDEESPYFPRSTQEMREDVDVLWDYNSPQSRPKTVVLRRSKKRLNLQQPSPKAPLRRHPSNNNERIKQDFNKLREELKALRDEIAKPDHEESLILSPREEETFKITQEGIYEHHIEHFDLLEEQIFEDPFNDDMDDKLVIFSQQVEDKIQKTETELRKCNENSSVNNCDIRMETSSHCTVRKINSEKMSSSSIKKHHITSNVQDSEVFNDSFDSVLSQMNEDEFDLLTQVVDIKKYKNNKDICCNSNKNPKVFARSQSEDQIELVNVQTSSGKVEWHRTQSFENYDNSQVSKDKMKEIEKKRLQAKAKLEAKKKQEAIITVIPEYSDSPLKCSPEEIEKKRLQALAKLEAKRQQEIIERKKQEALKRRKESRKLNAIHLKSSLTTRL